MLSAPDKQFNKKKHGDVAASVLFAIRKNLTSDSCCVCRRRIRRVPGGLLWDEPH
jgi:hypothetical protein